MFFLLVCFSSLLFLTYLWVWRENCSLAHPSPSFPHCNFQFITSPSNFENSNLCDVHVILTTPSCSLSLSPRPYMIPAPAHYSLHTPAMRLAMWSPAHIPGSHFQDLSTSSDLFFSPPKGWFSCPTWAWGHTYLPCPRSLHFKYPLLPDFSLLFHTPWKPPSALLPHLHSIVLTCLQINPPCSQLPFNSGYHWQPSSSLSWSHFPFLFSMVVA